MSEAVKWRTESHELFQETVSKFMRDELVPALPKWREQGFVDRAFWLAAGELGLLGASIDPEFGGSGGDLGFDAIVLLEQGRCGDFNWGFGLQSVVMHYIATFGTREQKLRWLPKMVSGEFVCAIAMTEPGAGSDLQGMQTSAKLAGDNYHIKGAKTFISNGQTADFILLAAKTELARSSGSISLFGLETSDLKGFRRGRNLEKIGLSGQDTSELFFDDVIVSQQNLVGELGQGFRHMMEQLPWERLALGIQALGQMEFMLAETLPYVKDRKAFGQRIFDFQNTRFTLAEVATRVEVAKAFISSCIEKVIIGQLSPSEACMSKWWTTQMQCEVADQCLQLFGGYGYMKEYPISHAFVDARIQTIYGGTNEIMKEVIARGLDKL